MEENGFLAGNLFPDLRSGSDDDRGGGYNRRRRLGKRRPSNMANDAGGCRGLGTMLVDQSARNYEK
jgi:hypothetical protein